MPFLPETWRAKVTERLWEWRLRVEQTRPAAVYSALSAAVLWPLVQAAQSTGMLPVALALGNVVAGVGGNLIAEQIQRWHDQAQPSSEADVAAWITAHITTNADLRQALDTILEQLQVISQARECLQANDHAWFVQTLRTELEALGNLTHFEAHLTGYGAIAQVIGARAVGIQGPLIEPCKRSSRSSASLFREKAIPIRDQQSVLRHVLGSAGILGLCRYTTRGVEPLWAAGFLCD